MNHESAARRLSKLMGERLISVEDGRYDAARKVWNGTIDKRPWAIVRCVGTEDVSNALQVARDSGLPISVRGGGHQIAGGAIVEGGLVLDLQLLRHADVDALSGVVRVGGGALLGDLDRASAQYGMAVPAGVVSHTGVGGLVLGGGIGWLCRSRGLTCDNLVSATVVLADGSTVVASESRNPDLFWALRGGGGNFGIVTEFEFSAEPIGPVVRGTRAIAIERAEDALLALGALSDQMPRELQVVARLQRSDPESMSPTGAVELLVEWLWSGSDSGAAAAEALMQVGAATRVDVRRQPFSEVQGMQDHRFPHGARYYMKPGHLAGIGVAQVEALMTIADTLPSGDCQVEIMRLGGAVSDVDEMASAFPRRDTAFAFNLVGGRAPDSETYGQQVGWVQASHARLSATGPKGAYANFAAGSSVSLEDVFGAEKVKRLRDAKRTYDPDDVLRPSLHIPPSELPQMATSDN